METDLTQEVLKNINANIWARIWRRDDQQYLQHGGCCSGLWSYCPSNDSCAMFDLWCRTSDSADRFCQLWRRDKKANQRSENIWSLDSRFLEHFLDRTHDVDPEWHYSFIYVPYKSCSVNCAGNYSYIRIIIFVFAAEYFWDLLLPICDEAQYCINHFICARQGLVRHSCVFIADVIWQLCDLMGYANCGNFSCDLC